MGKCPPKFGSWEIEGLSGVPAERGLMVLSWLHPQPPQAQDCEGWS